MQESTEPDRERLAASMRAIARQLFLRALGEATVEKAFQRHVNCERGVLRICEDPYDLHAYSRTFIVSIGKAAHSMVEALRDQVGESVEGIIASSVEPKSQVRGFRYFHGGHPTPNSESIHAAEAMQRSVNALN